MAYTKDKPIVDANIMSSGTENVWNISDGYMKLKVLKFLVDADRYEIIANYGTENMDMQENFLPPEFLIQRRIEGLSRMKDSLMMTINNSHFALKKSEKPKISLLKERIVNVEKVFAGIYREETDQVSHNSKLIINEQHFRKCLDVLRTIKEELSQILNNAGLIFRKEDDADFDALMKDIVESG